MEKNKSCFNGISTEYIDFFIELSINNSKQWYEENKTRFIKLCKEPFTALAYELYEHISAYKPNNELKPHVSRVHKDMRHYHGGMLYNDHLWLSVRSAKKDWAEKPLFWFGMTPNGYDYGMGYFHISRDTLEKFRERIDANPERFKKIVADTANKQNIFILDEQKYKRRMADYSPDIMEWYQAKNLYLICRRTLDERVFSPDLAQMLKDDFDKIKDIYCWLLELHDGV